MRVSVEISSSLVRRLIAAQFPQWADLSIRPVQPGGWDNRSFRLGDDLLVRLPSAEHYAAQVDKEQQWLPFLARGLPLPIPSPVAMGQAGKDYPWRWSVYRWLEGEPATSRNIVGLEEFAVALADFLGALHRMEPGGGPPPGPHNFWRGGPLRVYDHETRAAIARVSDDVDAEKATGVWEQALSALWLGGAVWVHGDVAPGNLLVRNGRLSAVIDFGCCAVGDPACDLTIMWTLLSATAREAFRAALPLDAATWTRARGWTLWKALITIVAQSEAHPNAQKATDARAVLDQVLNDHGD